MQGFSTAQRLYFIKNLYVLRKNDSCPHCSCISKQIDATKLLN